jgi:hypothetical protein
VSLYTDIVRNWAELVQRYDTYCGETWPHRCPGCGQPRPYFGGHWRWVFWAAGHHDPLWVRHVRCAACHTVETLFPPWLLPYEEWTLWVLEAVLDAVLDHGASVTRVAAEWAVDPDAVVRRVNRWRAQAPALRQGVAQQVERWQLEGIPGSTWTPPPQTRSWDWSWLRVVWAACGLARWGAAALAHLWGPGSIGLVTWRILAPEVLPAGCVPAWAHLGRRLRHGPDPPRAGLA